jgi:hypothetical protein
LLLFLVIKLLALPSTLKNYVLAISDISYKMYFLGNFIYYILFTGKCLIIGSEMRAIKEIFITHEKSWEQMTDKERLSFIFFTCLIIVNLMIFHFVFRFIQDVIKQSEENSNKENSEKKHYNYNRKVVIHNQMLSQNEIEEESLHLSTCIP